MDDLAAEQGVDPIFLKVIEVVANELLDSIEQAAPKRPRSGIREPLLRAIIALHDAILPRSIDEVIADYIK